MKRRKRKRRIKKLIFTVLSIFLLFFIGIGACVGMKGYEMYHNAVSEEGISERVEEIRNMDNFTAYSELPQFYIQATVSIEDHRFKSHYGIDVVAIGRAMWRNIKAGRFVEGGSTITQQFAKNLLFTQDKSLERKVAEIFAAIEIESLYTKEEIFELYANTIYFGNGYYGVGDAAYGYFGKPSSELSQYECVMLAGVPNAPSVYSPDEDNELTVQRTGIVLNSMVRNKMISQEDADRIWKEK